MVAPVYRSGSDVQFTVQMPLHNGTPLVPSAVTRLVKDETGAIIDDSASVNFPTDGSDSFAITIGDQFNTLGEGVSRALRLVETTITTSRGVFVDSFYYVVRTATPLTRLSNSFVTLSEAMLISTELPTLDGWDAATEDQRIAALTTAYDAMCNLRYRFRYTQLQSRVTDFPGTSRFAYGVFYIIEYIRDATLTEWDSWPAEFTRALQKAQIVEADVILRGDPVGDKRRAGIVSESIGEAKMFFRQVPEVEMAISREALKFLRGFVETAVRIARA